MKKLKMIIKSAIRSDPLSFSSKDPSLSEYQSIVMEFEKSSSEKKIDLRSHLSQKLAKA